MELPDFVTHYYLPGRRPFLNLSDLGEDLVHDVMHELNELRRHGAHRRSFGRVYLEWRRLTEERLRRLFLEAGGAPERLVPHYFCLGHSSWFQGLADGMLSVTIPLAALPAQRTSFTLCDSFSAMGFGPQFGFPAPEQAHHGKVYRLDELDAVAHRYGLPWCDVEAAYDGFEQRLVDQFVEIQLWSDDPVRHITEPSGRLPR